MADRAGVCDNSGDHLVPVLSEDDGAVMLAEGVRDPGWVWKHLPEF